MLERGMGLQKIDKEKVCADLNKHTSDEESGSEEHNIDAASLLDFEKQKKQQSKKSPFIVSTREDGTI
jgi:hypothetical protein